MVIFIDVLDLFQDQVSEASLLEAAEKALSVGLGSEPSSLSLRITDADSMQSFNRQYREVDRSTDVLSFPADFHDPDLDSRYLGDVMISFPDALVQAQKRGHPVKDELQLLVVHGVLHLLGYDHGSPREKQSMWEIQNRILKELGLDIEVGEE